jgi:uncharacterized protein YcbK (DUF882 family)
VSKPVLVKPVDLSAANPELVEWVEKQLAIGGFLASDQANQTASTNTFKALAEFKKAVHLEYPSLIGETTIDALAELEPPHKVTEQRYSPQSLKSDPEAGKETGGTIVLPNLGTVKLNQFIVDGCKLTFREFTHGGTRLPDTVERVLNMVAIATVFGEIRNKFDAPIGVTSAYRPPEYNRRIGGAVNGFHPRAGALDIYPLNGEFTKLLQVIKASSAGGIGLGYPTPGKFFYHIDIGSRRYWKY